MDKGQAELEVGTPPETPMYGRQDEYPTAYNLEAPEYCEYKRRKEPIKVASSKHKTTIALSVALILCCAIAAVASYFALAFRAQVQNCSSDQPDAIHQALNSTNNTMATLIPTTSCTGLNVSYTSAINNTKFTTQCGTWFQGNNLLGVYVYTFEACMDACASYNSYDYMHNSSRCYSVTYDAVKENSGKGNCWLKARQNLPPTARKVTDSAVLT